ncbi:MAG: hypothetical protein KME32_33670 [Mojavia pulchra JT2-VF2]|jgi:hypothetical protein|uniref:Uncharacterized protein n=1 Tax=Mojavia pulchra JT2-VF2 TaxID=287848 RepID=A0A951Q565_9NOST|nr:hypothetical protein [Mojavia pulchra JT2-VF2]
MAKPQNKFSELTAANLLRSLRCRGGCAPLHTIKFSNVSIQYLLDRKLVKVQNTGCGFLLEIVEEMQ